MKLIITLLITLTSVVAQTAELIVTPMSMGDYTAFKATFTGTWLGAARYSMSPNVGGGRLAVAMALDGPYEDLGAFTSFGPGDALEVDFRFGPNGRFSTFGFGNTIDLTGVIPIESTSPDFGIFVINSAPGLGLNLNINNAGGGAAAYAVQMSDGSPLSDFSLSVVSNPGFLGNLPPNGFDWAMYTVVPEPASGSLMMLGIGSLILTWRKRFS